MLPTRGRPSWLTSGAVLAALLWARPGQATCEGPPKVITWTYPDAGTEVVPPDAVFWAVSPGANVTLSVDGVPLSPLGASGIDRFQFAPTAPLSEGMHELVAGTEDTLFPESAGIAGTADGGTRIDAGERRFRFRVMAAPAVEGDVRISSVEAYPTAFGGTVSPGVGAPREEYDSQCTDAATALSWGCNDTGGPSYLARVAYESEGAPIAYLVQGGYLVPPGCPWFWAPASAEAGSAQFRVAAVLPTGLAEEHVFAGPVDFPPREAGPVSSPGSAGSPSACAVGFGPRPARASALAAAALAILAACARRRTRSRA
jgi:hypothetical protein